METTNRSIPVYVVLPYITGPTNTVTYQAKTYSVVNECFTPTTYLWNVTSTTWLPLNYSLTPYGGSADITFYNAGSYLITVTMAGLPAGFQTCSLTVNIARGGSISPFNVYPNPVDDILYIDIDQQAIQVNSSAGSNAVPCEIRLYNTVGAMVLQTTTAGNRAQLNVSRLPDGMYFLHLYDGANPDPEIKQIIIKH